MGAARNGVVVEVLRNEIQYDWQGLSVVWDARNTAFQRLQAGNVRCTAITNL